MVKQLLQLTFINLKLPKTISFWALSLSYAYTQCPNFFYVKESLFSKTQSQESSRLDTLNIWLENWGKCQFPSDSTLAVLYYRLGNRYFNIEEYDKAINTYQFSINQLKKTDTKSSWLPRTNFKLGVTYVFSNDFEEAKKYLNKAIATKFKAQNINFIMECYYYLYFISKTKGDYEYSLLYLENAISIAKKTNEREFLCRCYTEKATVNLILEKTKNAIEILKLANNFSSNNTQKSLIDGLYATAFTMIGDYNKAIKYHNSALKKTDEYNKYTIYASLGNLYYSQLGDYQKAKQYYILGLNGNIDKLGKINIYTNLGKIYAKFNELEKTNASFNIGLNIAFDTKNKISFDFSNIRKIKVNNSIKLLFELVFEKAKINKILFTRTNKINYLIDAQKYFIISSKLIDYMRFEQTGTQSKYFWRIKTRPVYEAAIEACFLLKDYEKAFYFFEKSRSVLLNDKLNEMGANQKLSLVDQQKENDLQRKILELNTELESEKDEKKKENLNAKLIDFQESQLEFVKSLEEKNPAYYAMKYDTNVATLTHAQQYLKSNFNGKPATLVEYFVGDSATYAIIISTNKVDFKKINFNQKLANQFLELSSKSIQTKAELNAFLATSSSLYNQIIKLLNITKGHLIISQDGTFLPFEAMSTSEKTPQYLINDYAISYTYSAQVLLKNKAETSFLPTRSFIGFAPVNFQNLASLMGSKKSISNIGSHYALGTNLIEKEANKSAFLKQASNYQIVQLYTHAQADSNETEPRIYFADSSLKVSELSAENRFKTNLLVLSACKTGVGKLAKGEGILSLARGFSMLGIPSTITSLWSVEDIDTYTVTELFYKYLNKGFAKDEALQKAKIEFINLNQNAMPNQWAGLVLVGETSPINSIKYLQYLIGIFGLIIVAFIIYRKRKALKLPFQS